MGERVDRKLQEVVVARYSWRHEAEFAAGFLADAGIPYRLQIDDPSLGISVSAAATLWVRGADEAKARDVLDLNEEHAPRLSGNRSRNHPAPRARRPPPARPPGEAGGRLPWRVRIVAVLGGMGLAGVGAVGFVGSVLEPVVAVLAIGLILTGLVGWAPRALRDLLLALSGQAP